MRRRLLRWLCRRCYLRCHSITRSLNLDLVADRAPSLVRALSLLYIAPNMTSTSDENLLVKYEHDIHRSWDDIRLAWSRALVNLDRVNTLFGVVALAVTLVGFVMVEVVQAGKDAVADYHMSLLLLLPFVHVIAFLTEIHVLHFLISSTNIAASRS